MSTDPFEAKIKFETFLVGESFINSTSVGSRVTHVPTGTVVVCEKHKSYHKNRAEAVAELRRVLGMPVGAE